jgi:hypothetical protein
MRVRDVIDVSLAVAYPLAVVLWMLAGCAPAAKLRVVNYCDLPQDDCRSLAEAPPDIQAQLLEQSWCCPEGQPCIPVNAITDCAITDVAIYCEYGRSSPVSTEGGTSGFECFG